MVVMKRSRFTTPRVHQQSDCQGGKRNRVPKFQGSSGMKKKGIQKKKKRTRRSSTTTPDTRLLERPRLIHIFSAGQHLSNHLQNLSRFWKWSSAATAAVQPGVTAEAAALRLPVHEPPRPRECLTQLYPGSQMHPQGRRHRRR